MNVMQSPEHFSRAVAPCVSAVLAAAALVAGCGGGNHGPGPDGTPPATITDLTVLAADDTSITLGWTAPGDDGDRGTAARYDLRYSLDQLPPAWNIATPIDSLPPPHLAGQAEAADLFPLKQKQVYYFSLRTFDAAGNASEFSNAAQGQTGDPEPPGPVTDLAVAALTHRTVTLTFTAPGDDAGRGTVVAYDLRESPRPITDSTWASATKVPVDLPPHPGGTVETVPITGLEPLSVHHYMVRGRDDAGKIGPLGNDLEVTLLPDTVPPAAIADLGATSTVAYRATLTWTAPGDDGTEGKATSYRIRYREGPITDEAAWDAASAPGVTVTPGAAGIRETVQLVELPGAATVSFAVRAVDAAGNLAPLSNPASVYVGGPGRTWEVNVAGTGDAPTVQAAIDSAVTGDIVVVGPGRYYENIDFLGKDITVWSAEGPEATILDGSTRDSSVVVIRRGETRNAVLEGFTITGGRGHRETEFPDYDGGGIYCAYSSPVVRNNWIVGNSVAGNGLGGGMLARGSNALIEDNRFEENETGQNGGGLGLREGTFEVRKNIFRRNLATADGGGIWVWRGSGSVLIEGNQFWDNEAGDHGGGIYLTGWGAVRPDPVRSNLLVRNQTVGTGFFGDTGSGGGMAILAIAGCIEHNTVVANDGHHLTECGGGGVLLWRTGPGMLVTNNLIVSNEQCGVSCWEGDATFGPNEFWQNEGGDLGGSGRDCPEEWRSTQELAVSRKLLKK
jgi:hypothetical protein